jgi:transcriptional regulator with XRE-family HTH domain
MEAKELGARIRRAREEIGLSQEQLGRLMDRSHAAISDMERGKTKLGISDLSKLARFLQKDISYFIGTTPSAVYRRGELTQTENSRKEVRSAIEDFRRYARLLSEKEESTKR